MTRTKIKRALRPPNFPWEQFFGKDNGPSGIQVVTHPERRIRAAFSDPLLQSMDQGKKAGQHNRNLALH